MHSLVQNMLKVTFLDCSGVSLAVDGRSRSLFNDPILPSALNGPLQASALNSWILGFRQENVRKKHQFWTCLNHWLFSKSIVSSKFFSFIFFVSSITTYWLFKLLVAPFELAVFGVFLKNFAVTEFLDYILGYLRIEEFLENIFRYFLKF